MIEIIDIFKTPVYAVNKNLDLNYYNKKTLEFEKKYNSRKKSNLGGYQSPNLIDNESVFRKKFFNDIKEDLSKFYSLFNINKNIEMSELWLNINRKNSSNKLHDHPHSFMSGVFYINAKKDNGDLVFYNDFNKGLYTENFHSSYIKEYNPYNSSSFRFNPENNFLVLFLSSTWHEVEPNLTDDERISLSFNLK